MSGDRPTARVRITLRGIVCLIVALIAFSAGGIIFWHTVFVKFTMLGGIVGATLIGGAGTWLYSDYIEPLFYRLPGDGTG